MFEVGGHTLAFVLETLGTKSIIAREMEDQLGPSGFEHVAYDTVAAIVNDLCCVGALPLVVNAYFATGLLGLVPERAPAGSAARGLAGGVRRRGGGLGWRRVALARDLVASRRDRARGQRGRPGPAKGSRHCSVSALEPGDEIVLVASSGLHANGASLGRKVAGGLPQRLPDAAAQRSVARRGIARPEPDLRQAGRKRCSKPPSASTTSATSPATASSS